jgi:hypothetical protein
MLSDTNDKVMKVRKEWLVPFLLVSSRIITDLSHRLC